MIFTLSPAEEFTIPLKVTYWAAIELEVGIKGKTPKKKPKTLVTK
jgi:hypothetical protein